MLPEAAFARALRDPAQPAPTGLDAGGTGRRFDVYRNNVAVSLVAALAARFPVCQAIVGDTFFAAMARDFAVLHPPRSPLLFAYGDDFAAFIDDFAPAAGVEYLADVARLEAACSRAGHAADALPLKLATLATLSESDLQACHLVVHPAVDIVVSAHPIVQIWAAHQPQAVCTGVGPWSIAAWTGETALVTRPDMKVMVQLILPEAARLLVSLGAGQAFGMAVADAFAARPDLAVGEALAVLFGAGAFSGATTPAPPGPR